MEFLNLVKLGVAQCEVVGYYERKLYFLIGYQNAPCGMLLVFREDSKTVLKFNFAIWEVYFLMVGKLVLSRSMTNFKGCKCKRTNEILNGKMKFLRVNLLIFREESESDLIFLGGKSWENKIHKYYFSEVNSDMDSSRKIINVTIKNCVFG